MRWRVFAVAVVSVVWLLGALGLASRLASDANNYVNGPCEIPSKDSQYGTATWGMWPPGETCRDDSGHVFRSPSTQRSALATAVMGGVVVIPLLTWSLVQTDRARRQPPDATFADLLGAENHAE